MDGLAMRVLCANWNERFHRAKIEKIHQPSDRELVFTVRTREETARLLFSAHRTFARVHVLGRQRPANPEEPPMFCMLMRKRLESGRILEVRQQGWDRVVEVVIENTDEIGDIVHYVLVVEVMGKHSNIILTSADANRHPQKIVDSIVHVGKDMSRVRQVLPGLPYHVAPPQDKKTFAAVQADDVDALQLGGKSAKAQHLALCGLVAGVGPTTAREVLHRAPHDPGEPAPAAVAEAMHQVFTAALERTESASVGLDELGYPVAAAPFHLTSFPGWRPVASVDEGLEQVYAEATTRIQQTALAKELERIVDSQMDRLRGKRQKLLEQQVESVDHEAYRVKGELLTAYAHQVDRGASSVVLPDFYNAEAPLMIELDPALSAIENAQRYFKAASKKKRAIPVLEEELAHTVADLHYLENVMTHLQGATADNLQAVRKELEQQGFIAPRTHGHRKKGKQPQTTSPSADVYESSDGYTVRVGRNNTQNDKLTLRSSQPSDVWLHVKDQPGSHVVISSRGTDLPESTLYEAALLAAYFSKGRASSNVPVDYTLVKDVWKPGGARPGAVLYKNQKTLYVTPDRTILEEILKRKQP